MDTSRGFCTRRAEARTDPSPHQQAADQPWTAGNREQIDVRRLDARLLEREVQQMWQPLEVIARGQLRDDAAEFPVQVDLGVDDVAENPATSVHNSDRSFVAAGFDSDG